MNKLYTFITAVLLLVAVKQVQAQSSGASFAVQHDTVAFTTAGGYGVTNGINNLTSGPIGIRWKVVATNFPSDWIAGLGICDNVTCLNSTSLWPGDTGSNNATYGTGMGSFSFNVDLTAASPGTYFLKVKLANAANAADSIIETYIVSKFPTAVPTTVKPESDVVLYPNPAVNELNVVYDASADIKTIAIYNIIGKVMTVYKATVTTGARLNLDNLSSGAYFVRLMNSHGDVFATRKFTKQ